MSHQDKFNEAINHKRNGEFKKAIAIYETLLEEVPLEMELYSALGKVFYLDNQFEKAMLNYLIAFHLKASNNFAHYALPLKEYKTAIIDDSFHLTVHAGSASLILGFNRWKPKLAEYFDVEESIDNYTDGLMGKIVDIDEPYCNFTHELGGIAFLKYIQWDILIIKNQNDLTELINIYKSVCEIKESFAA